MDPQDFIWLTALAGAGVVAGLVLLVRGMIDYRSLLRVADTSTSAIDSLAAGEVRISGTIEIAETTLVSLIERIPCVYYRTTVGSSGDHLSGDPDYTEERSIGFRVRDATGSIRVFPRGARIEAPEKPPSVAAFMGGDPLPPDILRAGSTVVSGVGPGTTGDGALTVPPPETDEWTLAGGLRRSQPYHEARLELGDPVTIVGRALPFSDLPDPTAADAGSGSDPLLDDPEIAADMAAAISTGSLADDPAAAWGNAAIPGFGIGQPVRTPVIDAAANPLPIAGPTEAARIEHRFEIAPETLVLAASDEVPLLIAYGIPGQVVARSQTRFVIGLLGAILAIASAMALAIIASGGFAS